MESETYVLKDTVDWREIPSSHNRSATGLLQASEHADEHRVVHVCQSTRTFHCQSRTQRPGAQPKMMKTRLWSLIPRQDQVLKHGRQILSFRFKVWLFVWTRLLTDSTEPIRAGPFLKSKVKEAGFVHREP